MIYESGKDADLGGVSGVQVVLKPAKPIHFIEFIYNILFLIAPVQPGGVTLSGFSEQNNMQRVNPFTKLAKTQTLGGSGFSFHKKYSGLFRFQRTIWTVTARVRTRISVFVCQKNSISMSSLRQN